MRLGILHERIRKDEKLLIESAKKNRIDVSLLNDREIVFRPEHKDFDFDIVFERCINHLKAMYSMFMLERFGIPTVNSSQTAEICGSKFLVTQALVKKNIPTPRVSIAFTPEKAIEAIEETGYPAVLKPAVGSWGKLLAKVNDREAAEAVLDHKSKIGTYHHSVFYIQEYINKPQRDIRAFVVGDKVAAVYRSSKHWITHLDKGAVVSKCAVNHEIRELSLEAAKAVKGDIVAVDILETGQGMMVLEVDYTPEFSDYFPALDKKIIDDVIKYLIEKVKK